MSTPKRPAKTLRQDARALVESCSGLNSRLAARRITQLLEREMRKNGFSLVQIGLMAQIASAADDTHWAPWSRRLASINRRSRAICGRWSAML